MKNGRIRYRGASRNGHSISSILPCGQVGGLAKRLLNWATKLLDYFVPLDRPQNGSLVATQFPAVVWCRKSWQIAIPGTIEIATSPIFESSSLRHPENPGWTPAAVSITSPRLPQEDLPITYPPKSAGSRTHSNVTPKTKVPGCSTNVSPKGTKCRLVCLLAEKGTAPVLSTSSAISRVCRSDRNHRPRRTTYGSRCAALSGRLSRLLDWSGRRDSNPRPQPWQGWWQRLKPLKQCENSVCCGVCVRIVSGGKIACAGSGGRVRRVSQRRHLR